jgi:hypothetical protein
MRTVSLDRSIVQFWEELIYTEAALRAYEETAALAAPVTATLDDFAKIMQVDLDTRRALIQARARAVIADENLDDGLREVHSNTLHLVRQDRSRKEYQTLFPGALTALIRHALAKQIAAALAVIQKLGLSLFEPAFREAQVAVIKPLIDKGEAVLDERKDAELGRVEGRLEIETWKEEANAVRMSVYAQLLTVASGTKRKRSWAEGFFPTTSARSSRDDADADEVGIVPSNDAEADSES